MTGPLITRVYLVRHGETEWNAVGRCQGTADIALSEAGVLQAEALARRLADVDIDAAYTSPLQRARRTAETVLGGRSLRAVAVPELAELSYGAWQGLRSHEWPGGEWERWTRAPWDMAFPDGESLDVVRRRAAPVLDRIVHAHSGETVLISAHGHVNRVLLLHAAHGSPDSFWSIAQPNGGAWLLEYGHPGTTSAVATEVSVLETTPTMPRAAGSAR